MFTKKNHTSLRESIQQPGQALDESWETVKVEANQLVTELQETYDDIMHAFKEILDRRRKRHHKPVVRFVQRYPWVPLAAGIGMIMAFVITVKSR